jgi:hypothetical protein
MHGHMAADSCDGEPRGEASLRRALLVPLGCIKAKGGPWMGGIVVLRRTLSAVGVVRAQHRYERVGAAIGGALADLGTRANGSRGLCLREKWVFCFSC